MEASTALNQLASIIEQFESAGNEIGKVVLQDGDLLAEDGLVVDVTFLIPVIKDLQRMGCVELVPTNASLTEESRILLGLDLNISQGNESTGSTGEADDGVEATRSELTDGENAILNQLDSRNGGERLPGPSNCEGDSCPSKPQSTADETTDRLAYKDPERLASIYDPKKTFEEMTDTLDVDVTPQTVRNYMIEYDIHTPKTERAPPDDSEESTAEEELETDDFDAVELAKEIAEEIELPDNIPLVNVIEAVCTAKTLHEVHTELQIDRDQARTVLQELNLLDLVHGRLSTRPSRSRTREEVDQRIYETVIESTSRK